ncbi:MAG: hypothetical protein RIM99_08045 [Cyclobacteriaceae bacterium]
MKLTPGYYKIRKKGRNFRSNCHFLRVIIHTDQKGSSKKYFQIDHGLPTEREKKRNWVWEVTTQTLASIVSSFDALYAGITPARLLIILSNLPNDPHMK